MIKKIGLVIALLVFVGCGGGSPKPVEEAFSCSSKSKDKIKNYRECRSQSIDELTKKKLQKFQALDKDNKMSNNQKQEIRNCISASFREYKNGKLHYDERPFNTLYNVKKEKLAKEKAETKAEKEAEPKIEVDKEQ